MILKSSNYLITRKLHNNFRLNVSTDAQRHITREQSSHVYPQNGLRIIIYIDRYT